MNEASKKKIVYFRISYLNWEWRESIILPTTIVKILFIYQKSNFSFENKTYWIEVSLYSRTVRKENIVASEDPSKWKSHRYVD